MDISLARVLAAARERQATLTPEVAGYVILLAAQQVAAERSRVSADSVRLDEAGDVLVARDIAASELDVEAALRGLLAALIGLCVSPPPAIGAVASRRAGGDLRGLVAELSSALIPINHSAAHRALARLYRETRRADGHLRDTSLQPISERRSEPERDELEIDVVVEPDESASARDRSSPVQPELASAAVPAPDLWSTEPTSAEPEPTALPAVAPVASMELWLQSFSRPAAIIAEAPSPSRGDERHVDSPPLGPSASNPRGSEARSDVYALLDAFLAETRSVERMPPVLRDMIGLQLPSAK